MGYSYRSVLSLFMYVVHSIAVDLPPSMYSCNVDP